MARRVLEVQVIGDTKSLSRALGKASGDVDKFAGRHSAASQRVVKSAKIMGAAITTGVVGGLSFAVKSAASFEQQLSSLGAVANATGKDMEKLRQQALKAGADTAFSAKEAAVAQTELAKGGLTVTKILRGGLNSALSLAAAGELELGEAASITANAMNLFGLRGGQATKVADALATAANVTTADVSDFGMALKQAGGVAKTAGLSFTETVAGLESLAAAGIKNSDAGTSMKAALLALLGPSQKQLELQESLGISFVDSSGKMKDLSSVSDMLRREFGDMGEAQRLATLKTLAGADGVRFLTSLYDAGPAKIDKYRAGLEKQGTAAEVAARKQDNLAGRLEQLKGSVETLGIEVGSALIPMLSDGAEAVTKFVNQMGSGEGAGGKFADAVTGVANVARDATAPVIGFASAVASGDREASAAVGALGGLAASLAAVRVASVAAAAVEKLTTALSALKANPLVAVGVAAGALVGYLISLAGGQRSAEDAARGHAAALRGLDQAMDDLEDKTLRVSEAKAALKSSTIAVEEAEKRYKETVKASGKGSLEARRAESDLTTARIAQKRSANDLKDALREQRSAQSSVTKENVRARDELNATRRATEDDISAEKRRIETLKQQRAAAVSQARTAEDAADAQAEFTRRIEASEDKIARMRDGLKNSEKAHDKAANKVEKHGDKVNRLGREINKLDDKTVTVRVNFNTSINKSPGSDAAQRGDGWGIGGMIQQAAQQAADAGKFTLPLSGETGLNAFNNIATQFGLSIGSGFRPGSITSSGNLSYHAMGRARDFPGTASDMIAFARYLAANFGSRLKELIYTPLGFSIKDGRRVPPFAQADHNDHVHVAMNRGGKVPGAGNTDTVPALLTPGEFVIRKQIVDKFGLTFFAGLNRMNSGGLVFPIDSRIAGLQAKSEGLSEGFSDADLAAERARLKAATKRGSKEDRKQAIRDLREFNKEAERARKLARIDVKIAGLERLKAWKEAIADIRSEIADKLNAAVDAFKQKWEATTGAAFDAETEAFIANSPAAKALRALREESEKVDRAAEDAAQAKALRDAQMLGGFEGLGTYSADSTFGRFKLAAIAEAQAAIDRTRREREEVRLTALAEAEAEEIRKTRDAERIARFDQEVAAFREAEGAKLQALVDGLEAQKVKYADFVKAVNEILAGLGVDLFVPSVDQEGATNKGPGKKKKSSKPSLGWGGGKASGGRVIPGVTYKVGETGPEMFTPGVPGQITPASMSGRSGGISIHIGEYHAHGRRDAEILANKLAHRVAFA